MSDDEPDTDLPEDGEGMYERLVSHDSAEGFHRHERLGCSNVFDFYTGGQKAKQGTTSNKPPQPVIWSHTLVILHQSIVDLVSFP